MPRAGDRPLTLLFIADVVGRPGVAACVALVPKLRQRERADFVVVNAENAAEGVGLTARDADDLLGGGADVLTAGNHILRRRKIAETLRTTDRLLRPANLKSAFPGRGVGVYDAGGVPVGVVCLLGKVFLDEGLAPFDAADGCVAHVRERARVVLVDFHAEATSEKKAMGLYLDGRVSVVVGTHTHVQTADEQVLPGGTAYLTDAGMTGPYRSVIGVDPARSIAAFRTGAHQQFTPAAGIVALEGAVIDVDPATGKALAIRRIRRFFDPEAGAEVEGA
jgi:metallophosphoesterase (TIGR00282 family)